MGVWLWLFFALSICGLVAATYTDLKKRIIYNKLTYPLIFLGLALHALRAFSETDFFIFGSAAAVTALAFLGSYGLWKAGVWAGGDVKMMAAIAALNPVNYAMLRDAAGLGGAELFSSLTLPAFPLTLFVCSVFAMLPYGAAISVHGIAKDKKLQGEFIAEVKKRSLQVFEFSLLIVGLQAVVLALGMPALVVLPLLIVIGILGNRVTVGAAVAAFAYALFVNYAQALWMLAAVFLPLLAVYLLIKLYLISKERVLKKDVRISELKEGMISAEVIAERAGKITRVEGLNIGRIIKYFKDNNLQAVLRMLRPEGRIVVGRSASGMRRKQIAELKEAVKKGRIGDHIRISLSAPFVPAMLIAYVALQIVGDALWNLVF